MLKAKFNPAKSETTCRLCVGRIKLAKNKKALQQRQLRKEIAELLRNGKQEYARIRVEAIIRECLLLQAYEILELFLELIAVRSALISQAKEIPRDMVEAISSVIYAAQRVPDLPELTTMRALLAAKYGKEYIAEASSDVHCTRWQVNEKLKNCLMVEAPSNEEKLETLSEIAQEFHVEWDIGAAARDLLPVDAPGYNYDGNLGAPPAMPSPNGYSAHMPAGQQHNFYPTPSHHGQEPQNNPYSDVHAAAHAANVAAQQAQAAAEYAAQLAAKHGMSYPPANTPSVHDTQSTFTPSQNGSEDLSGWLKPPSASDHAVPSPSTQPPPSGPFAPSPPTGPFPPPPPGAPATMGGYVVRPETEVQSAYDKAMGPPVKPAPSADAGSSAPGPATAAPPPPEPTAPAPKPASNELDELQKRFDALKRS